MSAALRLPTSWNDKRLLEDSPFSEVFRQRKYFGPQQGRRSDDWLERLATEIKDTPNVSIHLPCSTYGRPCIFASLNSAAAL